MTKVCVFQEWIYYSDSEAIDLTHEPHLFVLLPATMHPVR